MDTNNNIPMIEIDGEMVPALIVGGKDEKHVAAYRALMKHRKEERSRYEAFLKEKSTAERAPLTDPLTMKERSNALEYTAGMDGKLSLTAEVPDITGFSASYKVLAGDVITIRFSELPPLEVVTVEATFTSDDGKSEKSIEHVVRRPFVTEDPDSII